MKCGVVGEETKSLVGCGTLSKTGQVLAYVFGVLKTQSLSSSSRIKPSVSRNIVQMDGGAYERYLPVELHEVGKRKTQRIERKHLQLRTRIKTTSSQDQIAFSKTGELMYDLDCLINR